MNSDPNRSAFCLSELAEAACGKLYKKCDAEVTGFALDSRKVRRGDCFLAVKGENTDGHAYIQNAWDAGASLVIASVPPAGESAGNLLLVDDTIAALGRIAREYKKSLSPLTVAVTGSVGKTTTKEFIWSVLSADRPTHKTNGNYNNELGLPLTLLSLLPCHKAAVLEMGMSCRGEIEYLSLLAQPDIAVITCIGTSHIEALGSREAIRDAKMEITRGLKPDGTLILSGDEPLLAGADGALYVSLSNPLSDFYVENIRSSGNHTYFDVHAPNGVLRDLDIPIIGTHNVFDAAVAAAVGTVAGVRESAIRDGLSRFENTGMRQKIENLGGVTLISDCYNASPESMKASLQVLKQCTPPGGRSIAVLGEMRELGSFSHELHREVGAAAAKEGVSLLFTFGTDANAIAEGAEDAHLSPSVILRNTDLSRPEATAQALLKQLRPCDTVLFKASRAVALERVIELVKKEL